MAEVTFPQLIQRACGIAVHLKVVVATIDGVGLQRETRSFKTFTSSLNELKEWLLSNGVTPCCNGKYRCLLEACSQDT